MSEKEKLAIFDIDGTIFRSSLFIELVNQLIHRGIFDPEDFRKTYRKYQSWVNRKGSYDEYLMEMFATYLKALPGCKEIDVLAVAADVFEEHKDKVYRYTRDLVASLRADNYFLLAISGSPEYLLEKFCNYYKFNEFVGSVIEVKNGIFTERVIRDPVQNKKKVLHNFLEENKKQFDLERSIGVGDSEADILFLEMVGEPIVFNPSGKLLAHAREEKWKVVIERKDVIYTLGEFKFKKAED